MHRLSNRLKKFERAVFSFDTSPFTYDERVELTKLVVRKHFGVDLSWREAAFLTYRSAANVDWYRVADLTPAKVRAWFARYESEIDHYHADEPLDDVNAAVWRKLSSNFVAWEEFVRRPNWMILFSSARTPRRPKVRKTDQFPDDTDAKMLHELERRAARRRRY